MTEIHATAVVSPDAQLGPGTVVGPYAVIEGGVVLGAGNTIGAHAYIGQGTALGDRNQIHPMAIIGYLPQDLSFDPLTPTYTRIGNDNVFREYTSVHRATTAGEATLVGDHNMFMAHTHLAHDCRVGSNAILVNHAIVAGHCEIGDRVLLSGLTAVHQFSRIGRLALVSGLSVANKDLPPFFTYGGRPALAESINAVGLRRAGICPEVRIELKEAYRILYRLGLPIPEALEQIEAELHSDEVKELVTFVRDSKRGITVSASGGEDSLSKKPHRATARGSRAVRKQSDQENPKP